MASGTEITCASTFIFEFSQTIANFSVSADVLQGPSIPIRIPGLQNELYIELEFKKCYYVGGNHVFCSAFIISLKSNDIKDANLTVASLTSLCNTNHVILQKVSTPTQELNGSIILLEYHHYSRNRICKLDLPQLMNLLDDKLVIEGILSFRSPEITCRMSPPILKEVPEAFNELSKDFKDMYESGSSSDVIFLVGEKTLNAHKFVLRSRSPVFAKRFDNDMLENNTNKIVIEDSDHHAFNCFLMFLYGGIVEDKEVVTLLSLYALAHKYEVKSLHAICSRLLIESLTVDSVCRSLVLADLHGDKELKDRASVFVRHHIIQVACAPEWCELVVTNPRLGKEVLEVVASQTK